MQVLSRIPDTIRKKEIFNPTLNYEIAVIPKNPKDYYNYFIDQLNLARSQDKNLLYKIFLEHSFGVNLILDVVLKSDIIIFNYRNNILHQWISEQKAKVYNRWSNYDLTNYQITWDVNTFLDFRNRCLIIYRLASILNEKGFKIPFLNYEKIHKFKNTENKIEYINDNLKILNININNFGEVPLTKQNLEYDYKKCFINYDSFLEFKNTELFYLNKLN